MSADNNSANSDGEQNSGLRHEQSGIQAGGIRISAQTSNGEAVSITVGQKQTGSDSISARDSVTEENRQILSSTAMSDSSSLFILGLRDNKQSASVPGLLLQDHTSSVREKKEIQTVQEDWLGPGTTLDTQALQRIVQPEHEAEQQNISVRDKVTDPMSEINRAMRVYRTGIDHVFAGNLQAGIDMITATKAILEGNAPSSVIAELNHYLAVAYARLEQKPGQESSPPTTGVAGDTVHFGVSGNLQVQNIFDTLTAEQVVHSGSNFHDVVQAPHPTDSAVVTGIDESVILDSSKHAQSSDTVETTELELVTDEPESLPAVIAADAEPAKKQPTKDRQAENQNQDPARIQEQAQQAEQAREKRKQIALKILRKLPFKNLRKLGRTSEVRYVRKGTAPTQAGKSETGGV